MPQITPLLTLMFVHTCHEESIPRALLSACNAKLNSLQPTFNFHMKTSCGPKLGALFVTPHTTCKDQDKD